MKDHQKVAQAPPEGPQSFSRLIEPDAVLDDSARIAALNLPERMRRAHRAPAPVSAVNEFAGQTCVGRTIITRLAAGERRLARDSLQWSAERIAW